MTLPFRLIDSVIRAGRLQVAYDQALIDLHRAGKVPDSLRFHRCHPTVFVGRHQAVAHAVKVEDCFADIVDIVRRAAGGGAVYRDQDQLSWQLVLSRERLAVPTLDDCMTLVGNAVAQGLSAAFGIDARVRPPNHIEVAGKTVCAMSGLFDGDTLVVEGAVFVDIDPARAVTYLHSPDADYTSVSLKTLLGEAPALDSLQAAIGRALAGMLGVTAAPADISPDEHAVARAYHDDAFGTDEFVFAIDDPRDPAAREASHTGPGGTVTVFLHLDGHGDATRIRDAVLSGDFVVMPPRLVKDLETALCGVPSTSAEATVLAFFAQAKSNFITLAPTDIAAVIANAALPD